MKKYLFIDIFTQKGFIENFGSAAIEDCPNIRENLMDVTSIAIKNEIPVISLMWNGFSQVPADLGVGSDFEKVADTEMSNSGFGEEFQQKLISVSQLDLSDLEFEIEAEQVLFVYGVPLESEVLEFCTKYVSKCAKLWLVQDAVKETKGDESEILAQLKELGVKMITTRNLEKFINI